MAKMKPQTPTSHPSREALAAYARGGLEAGSESEIERHLESCPDCGEVFDAISAGESQFLSKLRRNWTLPYAGDSELVSTSGRHAPEGDSETARSDADGPGEYGDSENWPKRVGRYRICGMLGSGAFGEVFHGRHELVEDMEVAIKVARPAKLDGRRKRELFFEEARALAALRHPGILPILEVDLTDDGRCYIVTRLIRGRDLSKVIRESAPVPSTLATRIVADAANALHYAHTRGLVHRDVKPGNILLDGDGAVFVTDFGLALAERDYGRGANWAGTPAYMSPEQARGEAALVDGRSDIFALGVVLYELLTGRRPFVGQNKDEILHRIRTVEPRPPRQIDDRIPKELERICLKALSKSLTDRYTTAKDLASDLRRLTSGGNARRRSWAAGLLLVVLLVVGAFVGLYVSSGAPNAGPSPRPSFARQQAARPGSNRDANSVDPGSATRSGSPPAPQELARDSSRPSLSAGASQKNTTSAQTSPADFNGRQLQDSSLEPVFSLSFDKESLVTRNGREYILANPGQRLCALGGAKWTPAGKVGGAVYFDGRAAIRIPDNSFPLNDDARSVVFWLRMSNPTWRMIPFHYGRTGHGHGAFDIAVFEPGNPDGLGGRLTLSWAGDPSKSIASSSKVDDGEWHHAGIVYNGEGKVTLYVDGRQSASASRRFATSLTGWGNLGNYPAPDHGFVGWLDEFALFARVLSEEEIRSLAGGRVSKTTSASTSPESSSARSSPPAEAAKVQPTTNATSENPIRHIGPVPMALYIADEAMRTIYRANPDGSDRTAILSRPTGPRGIALDPSGGRIYWVEPHAYKICRANLDGSNVEELLAKADGLGTLSEIVLDVDNGRMYWADSGTIRSAKLDGSIARNVIEPDDAGAACVSKLAIDVNDGRLYWIGRDPDGLWFYRGRLDGTNIERLTNITSEPVGGGGYMSLDVKAKKAYWCEAQNKRIRRCNFDGTEIEEIPLVDAQQPNGILVDHTTNTLYWTDIGTDRVERSNPDGSRRETILSTGLGMPRGIQLLYSEVSHE